MYVFSSSEMKKKHRTDADDNCNNGGQPDHFRHGRGSYTLFGVLIGSFSSKLTKNITVAHPVSAKLSAKTDRRGPELVMPGSEVR